MDRFTSNQDQSGLQPILQNRMIHFTSETVSFLWYRRAECHSGERSPGRVPTCPI